MHRLATVLRPHSIPAVGYTIHFTGHLVQLNEPALDTLIDLSQHDSEATPHA